MDKVIQKKPNCDVGFEHSTKLLDCTLRDGGYYNSWNFSINLVRDYLEAMVSIQVDYVEIGFRFLNNSGFKGGCAFSTDEYIDSLNIPNELKNKIGVMINGSDIVSQGHSQSDIQKVLEKMFVLKEQSPVSLVRIACHANELKYCFPIATWLRNHGYKVGFNLMQINNIEEAKLISLLKLANSYPIDVMYFADSLGALNMQEVDNIVRVFKNNWHGEIGIHAHDNMGNAINNSMQAVKSGVSWVDGTVAGMGRGPGNAKIEYLSIELDDYFGLSTSRTKLLKLIRNHFLDLKKTYDWGGDVYYYLAGKYNIHPMYVQGMIADSRYSEEDIVSVMNYLKGQNGEKFNPRLLESARHSYSTKTQGEWEPRRIIENKNVLIVGTGPSASRHRDAIQLYIRTHNPFVISLNTQKNIDEGLIDARVACHPVRILADYSEYLNFSQPLIVPASMLPSSIKQKLKNKKIFDFGIVVDKDRFNFGSKNCILPNLLALSYAMAIATSGRAAQIFLAGFDGYSANDPRRKEVDDMFDLYRQSTQSVDFFSVTETQYKIPVKSIYGPDL